MITDRLRPFRPLLRIGASAAAIACAAAAGLAVAAHASDPARHVLDLAQPPGSCGAPPGGLHAGPVTFQVTDDSHDYVNVYVIDDGERDKVYAEIQDLAPHATLALDTDLGAGIYAVRCVFSDGKIGTSAAISVTGTTDAAVPGYRAMPDLDLQAPVHEYTRWVESQLPKLLADSRTLDADVARGDLAEAKQAWLTAHLDYERLGAAYNAFGDFDGELDGMAGGLPRGVTDGSWTGFFAIEYALWHDQAPAKVRALTKSLVASVAALQQDFPSEEIDPGDLSLRAHEILENALQFQLTGIADYGSGTVLATVEANTEGTAELLSVLAPLITRSDPQLLTSARQGLAALQHVLAADVDARGTWRPVSALDSAQRQRLDADLGQVLETLSGVPALLYPRTGA
ncbi:EfeM/EfeO family lipoprotein [Actinospica sp. MGRD01-02]|uniref:EfeM/EfeO family lipoprotein n=1 Tax=Actinospica acidithermotolerans TaxID=2828514 RepID=A0A941IJD2_9ACTN|nr:EfeM/EfeO family lipoprotein [Actinospica acidithermotolerans]MBR7827742.1 EfeM/EfeO family lipoprotein [Actinospica acidithermotolerans]